MSSSSGPVIVGVSGDQPSVITYGAREAARLRTSLRVVHCSTDLTAGADAVVLAQSRAVVDGLQVAVDVDYVLEQGDPGLLLVDHARSAAALVIGVDDAEWTERVLGGKVSSVLALSAACPVTVVPWQLGEDSSGVIVTLDGDTSTVGPLRYGFEQADSRSEELHVLHATPVGTTADDTAVFTARVQREVERFHQIAPDVRARLSLTSGDSLEECIKATANASLLVIGRPHGRGHMFALTRPVAMLVLREARCAVVIVPSGYSAA